MIRSRSIFIRDYKGKAAGILQKAADTPQEAAGSNQKAAGTNQEAAGSPKRRQQAGRER